MPKICPHALLYHQIKTGKIKVHKYSPLEYRFWNKICKTGSIHPIHGQCWQWIGSKAKLGYGVIRVNSKLTLAHRVSWLLHFGEIPCNLFVLHHCDNPNCTNPKHLFLGTNGDNARDMTIKDRQSKGEHHPISKLNNEAVALIRKSFPPTSTGLNCKRKQKLAIKLGITVQSINNVLKRKYWKHLP